MARVPGPEGPSAPRRAAAWERFRRAAGILAHVCGLTLLMKRYIEKSRAEEWAQFYLSIKNHSANEILFNMSTFSKYNLGKDFTKLKTLMFIQPKQRSQKNLQEIQLCLKKNRSFHSLPNEVQLQLCQTAIYQELEAESMLLRQGHVPLECYLILAGCLKVTSSSTSMNKNTNSEILSEVEEGDFIGEICLLTNTNRPASISCKTDVKLLVISKDDFYCVLAQRIQEQCQETCSFLRSLPLFFSWPKEKIDVLVHCSLRRYYRTGPAIISDNFNSHFLVFIISGRCQIIAQMNSEEGSACSCVMKTGSSTLKNPHAVLPLRGPLDVTGRSLGTATISPRTSFSAAGKKTLDTKQPPLQMNPRVPQRSTARHSSLQIHGGGRAQKGHPQTSLATSGQSELTNKTETEVWVHGTDRRLPEGRRVVLIIVPVHVLDTLEILPGAWTNRKGPSSATCFIQIRVLEQGEIFGLAEALGRSHDLHLYLVRARPLPTVGPEPFLGKMYAFPLWSAHGNSPTKRLLAAFCKGEIQREDDRMRIKKFSEGVECIFIPKNLFLTEASTDFRRSASELVCAYPTEEALREYLVEQQVWNEYKARLLAQQLKRRS